MRSKTIGAAGDYATIALWEASIADTDDETGTVLDASATDTASVTLNAANTGGTRVYLLTVQSSAQFTAPTYASGTAKARIDVTSGDALTISGSGWIVERLYIESVGGAKGIVVSGVNAKLRRLLIKPETDGIVCNGAPGSFTRITNVAVFYPKNNSAYCVYSSGSHEIRCYHCTVRGRSGGLGFAGIYALTPYACIAIGAGGGGGESDFYGIGGFAGAQNVSYDTSAPPRLGSGSWPSQTGNVLVDIGDGTEDFALHADAQGDYGVTDRSGTEADLATDIIGTARTGTIDAGCWQTSSGGGGSAIKTINGLAIASVKTWNGLAIASVKTINGLA